ncbi:MAG TPA: hypothetical protein VGC84_01070 [Ilumatobacteraceae bacterium]|jgi:hypothetical protein
MAVALVVVMSNAGCAPHLVGPARTRDDFQRKAKTTAQKALSSVETVRLMAETAGRGDSFGPYTGITISEQEDSLNDVQGDFDSIQPPDHASDEVRAELDALLHDAMDHIAAVRVAARRGVLVGLDHVAAPLTTDSAALNSFLESVS